MIRGRDFHAPMSEPIEIVLARFATLMTEYDETPWYRFRRRWELQDQVWEQLIEMRRFLV
jgi:hypothetical protein